MLRAANPRSIRKKVKPWSTSKLARVQEVVFYKESCHFCPFYSKQNWQLVYQKTLLWSPVKTLIVLPVLTFHASSSASVRSMYVALKRVSMLSIGGLSMWFDIQTNSLSIPNFIIHSQNMFGLKLHTSQQTKSIIKNDALACVFINWYTIVSVSKDNVNTHY